MVHPLIVGSSTAYTVECGIGWCVVAGHHGELCEIGERYAIDLDFDQRVPLYADQAAALMPYADAIYAAYDLVDIDFLVPAFVEWI